MCGDSAGMIHPLSGNGMSMAIHSAKMLSDLLVNYFSEKNMLRAALETQYVTQWNKEFQTRLKAGRMDSQTFRPGSFFGIHVIGITSLSIVASNHY